MKTRRAGYRTEFRATCTCGWESDWHKVAGFAHGAEAAHKDECSFIDDARTGAAASAWPVEGNERFDS